MSGTPSVRRVVVAFDTAATPAQALEAAAALAVGLGAELVGLFVEDRRLLSLAALPFAQELGLATARATRVELEGVELSLRVRAERLRRVMRETMQPLGLTWTLEVVRGDVLHGALAYAGAETLLVIGRAPHAPPVAELRGTGQRFPSLRSRPVAVLFDGSAAARRALLLARTLTQVAGGELSVLIPSGDAAEFRERKHEAVRALPADRTAVFSAVTAADAAGITRCARAQRACVLLWPCEDPAAAGPAVSELLADAGCPIVVVG